MIAGCSFGAALIDPSSYGVDIAVRKWGKAHRHLGTLAFAGDSCEQGSGACLSGVGGLTRNSASHDSSKGVKGESPSTIGSGVALEAMSTENWQDVVGKIDYGRWLLGASEDANWQDCGQA